MAARPGRRERRKAQTRRALATAARRQFAERGFDATTVESICEEADVAVSTFYVYFDNKEATAFADADARAEVVERTLIERPADEPLHLALRRASHTVADADLRDPDEVVERLRLLAREPKLAAYSARLQATYVERVAHLVADQLQLPLTADPLPRLVVSAIFGVLNAAWATWGADPATDLHALVDQAHDTLDAGFERALSGSEPLAPNPARQTRC
jgi:AcrR family transcriptional regulator